MSLNSKVVGINLPNTLVEIGDHGLCGCTAELRIPDSVKILGQHALDNSSGLTYLSKNIESLDYNNNFKNTTWYNNLPEGIIYVGKILYSYKSNSSEHWNHTIINGTKSIYDYALSGCTQLESITIPDSVEKIGSYSFYGCTSLKTISIPDNVVNIPGACFSGCQNLVSAKLSDNTITIAGEAFRNCSKLTDFSIPTNVKSIGISAFENCCSLSKIVIPPGVTKIESMTFQNCTNLTSVILNEGLNSIGGSAFVSSGLLNLYLPKSLSYLDQSALLFCYNLEHIAVDNNNPNYSSIDGVLYKKDLTQIVKVPETKTGYYVMPDTIYHDVNDAYPKFLYCKNITDITLGKKYKYRDDSVGRLYGYNQEFFGCQSLQNLNCNSDNEYYSSVNGVLFDKTSKKLYAMPFNRSGIYSVPEGTTRISSGAFINCTKLSGVVVPSSVTEIADKSIGYKSENYADPAIIMDNISSFTIYGTPGSAAETYANNNGITFKNRSTLVFPTSISLNSSALTKEVGSASTLTATVYPSNATDKTVIWLTSNPKVATVSNGKVTAVAVGTATITAVTNNGKTATCTVTVTNPIVEVTGITLNKTSTTITKGNSETLTATITPSNATNKTVTWTTSNSSVATVSNGKVTAVAAGTATITAKSNNGKTATCTVTVTNPTVEVTGITLNKTSTTIIKGNSETLTATITPSNATNKTVTWSTSNSSVATVSNGKVTAVAVGTATITAKTNNGKTATCLVTVTTTNNFEWNSDNWNFDNDYSHFGFSSYRNQISSSYLDVLKSNLTNSEYEEVFVQSWYGGPSWLDEDWGGSCYGMSSTVLLSKNGLLPFENYKSGATKLYDLNYPLADNNVSSLVTYYQMLQIKDVIQKQYRTVPYRSNETNIKQIISLLDSNDTVLLGFRKNGWGGHAILAYGYEYGSYTFNGVTYQGCIKICDPNFSMSYNKNANIYFNTSSYNWAIPAYSYAGITSTSGATFNYIGAEVTEINKGGYLSGTSGNSSSNSFVARIDAKDISNNRSVSKVSYQNGNYINHSAAANEIIEDYSYILSGESEGMIGYTLFDPNSAYKISQDNAETMNMRIDYPECNLVGYSAAGKSITFDNDGVVRIESESSDYSFSMIFDTDYPTDWYSIKVSGSNANIATLKKMEDGFILEADNLEKISIKANNRYESANTTFTVPYTSVFIYEIDTNTIGLMVDTDNNGTYETEIETTQPLHNTSTINSDKLSVGSRIKLVASAEQGVAPYTYAYYYKRSTSKVWNVLGTEWSNTSTEQFTPKSVGQFDIKVVVKDATNQTSEKSFVVNVVDGKSKMFKNTSTINTAGAIPGTRIILTASASGSSDYKYAFYYKRTTARAWTILGNEFGLATTASFTPKTEGEFNLKIDIVDKNGELVSKQFALSINNSYIATSAINNSIINTASALPGTKIILQGIASGGSAPYTYAYYYKKAQANNWSIIGTEFSSATSASVTLRNVGDYIFRVVIKDTVGQVSKDFCVEITNTPEAVLLNDSTINATNVSTNTKIIITGAASGGEGEYIYSFQYKRTTAAKWNDMSSTENSGYFIPRSVGSFDVKCIVTDKAGNNAEKNFVVTVT